MQACGLKPKASLHPLRMTGKGCCGIATDLPGFRGINSQWTRNEVKSSWAQVTKLKTFSDFCARIGLLERAHFGTAKKGTRMYIKMKYN